MTAASIYFTSGLFLYRAVNVSVHASVSAMSCLLKDRDIRVTVGVTLSGTVTMVSFNERAVNEGNVSPGFRAAA